MDINLINIIIKMMCINGLIFMVNTKVLNYKIDKRYFVCIALSSILITAIYYVLDKYLDNLLKLILMYFMQLIVLKICIKDIRKNLLVSNLLSNSIVFIAFIFSLLIEMLLVNLIKIKNSTVNFILTFIIETVILMIFFNIKRFKKRFCIFR